MLRPRLELTAKGAPVELKILVCAQNEWYTQPIPCTVDGGPDTVITLSGFLFRSVGDRGIPQLEAFARSSV